MRRRGLAALGDRRRARGGDPAHGLGGRHGDRAARGRAGRAHSVSRARLRRQPQLRAGGGRVGDRGAGERRSRRERARDPARRERAALRRGARDRREQQHGRRAVRRGDPRRQALRQRTAARGGARLRRVQRRGNVLQAPTDDAKALDGRAGQTRRSSRTERGSTTRSTARSICCARRRSRPDRWSLLSDGDDVGSVHLVDTVVRAAQRQRVRIFTVGLRSGAYDPSALRTHRRRDGWRVRRGELRRRALGDLHRARASNSPPSTSSATGPTRSRSRT